MPVSEDVFCFCRPRLAATYPAGVRQFLYGGGSEGVGHIWSLTLYPGVELLAGDVHMPQFALPYIEQYSYLKFNYCTGGRCEVPLGGGRFAYLESGVLDIDLNQSLGALALPTGWYCGLEMIVHLDRLRGNYPAAWRDCGIDLLAARERLASRAGSIRLRPPADWDALARRLEAGLRDGSATPESARFHLLRLLYDLQAGGMEEITGSTFLTRGQRALVDRAVHRMAADLSARVSIEETAVGLGISASALKKYFAQVYGKPISVYLRELRLAKARQLLAREEQSIASVALAVGYQNQGKFGAVFREATGTTPSEYRRLCRAGQIK